MNVSQYRSCHDAVETCSDAVSSAGTGLTRHLHTQAYLPLLASAIRRGQRASFEIRGRCMWPALKPGDRVQVGPLARAPRRGDVLVSFCGTRAAAHRVVACWQDARGEQWVRCRGDAALDCDAPIRACQVLGVVEQVLRAGQPLQLTASAALRSRLAAPLRAAVAWLRGRPPRGSAALSQPSPRNRLSRP